MTVVNCACERTWWFWRIGGDERLKGAVDLAKTWSSGKAAKTLGISTNTLRNWDDKGLLQRMGVTVIKTPTGRRRFIPEEVEALADRIRRGEAQLYRGADT